MKLQLNGIRLSAFIFLLLFGITNAGVSLLPAHYDARFRMPRGTMRGFDKIVEEVRAQKRQGNPVVVVLGDSIGWGYSTRKPDETLANGIRLGFEREDPNRLPSVFRGRTPSVYNLSAIAAVSPDQYAMLMHVLDSVDMVVLQIYAGHYNEDFLKPLGLLIYPELIKGLTAGDSLSRELIRSGEKEAYPQRFLGGVEAPIREAFGALPLVSRKEFLLSRTGLELTDPDQLLKSLTGSSPYRPYPALSPSVQERVVQRYKEELNVKNGPKTDTAFRFLEGLLGQARSHRIPVAVVAPPTCPALRDLQDRNPALRHRMGQLRQITVRNQGVWLDYTGSTASPAASRNYKLTASNFHDFDHLVGPANTWVGEQIAEDLFRALLPPSTQ